MGIWALAHVDVLLVPPGKASNLLTDHLITGMHACLLFTAHIPVCLDSSI